MTDIIAVFLISVLCGMGVGGGGLPVLYFTLINGMEQKSAQGMNLVLFICAALASIIVNIKKEKPNLKITLTLIVLGCLSSFIGAGVANRLSSGILRKAFGIFLTLTGIMTLFRKNKAEQEKLVNKNV